MLATPLGQLLRHAKCQHTKHSDTRSRNLRADLRSDDEDCKHKQDKAKDQNHDDLPALSFYPGRFGDAPMQCDFSVLVTLQAAFANLSQARTDATTSS